MASLVYSDIETRVMNRLRIPTTNTTEAAKVRALINDVYRDIGMKFDWWWLVKRQVINTVDDISTGTVAVTNGSASITFSSAPTSSVAGRVLLVPGDTRDSGAVYRISTHTAGSASATLDATYTGDTASAASYNVYQDTYDLAADVGKPLHVRRYGYSWPLDLVGPEEIHGIKIYDLSEGKPQMASVIDFDTSGDPTTQKQLVVHPYPDDTYRLEISYKQTLNTELSGSTRPLIPDDYLSALEYGTLARGYPIFLDDVERGTFFLGLFNDIMALMTLAQQEKTGDRPRIKVRDQYRSFYRRGRVTAATADLGTFFDRWPMAH